MYRSVRPVTWGQSAESPCTVRSARCLTGRWSCSSRHELVWREIVETRMRPQFVVPPSCFDDHLCFGARAEPFEALALVPELAVKLSVTPFSQAGARSTPCRCRARRSRTPLRGTCSPAARHSRWLAAGEPGTLTSFLRRLPSSPRSRALARHQLLQPLILGRAASAAERRLRQL
jgi:hypothetical protein